MNSIRNVIHRSGLMQHHFGADELTCQLSGGGVVNYLGDITFDWNGMSSGSGMAIAAISPLVNTFTTGGGTRVSVETNTPAALDAFRQKFKTDKSLTPSLLAVKPNLSERTKP